MQDGISWLETTLTCVKCTRGHEGTRLETRHTCHANTVARQLRYFSRLSLRLKAEPATPCNMHGLSEATAVTTTVSGHSSQIDAVLLMFRFKAQALRERRPCQCRTSRVSWRKWGEEQRRNKEMEAKREKERDGGGRQDEERQAWPLLFMPLWEQGLSLCPVRLFRANRGWDGRQEGGCGGRMCSLKGKAMSHPSPTQ